MPAWILRPGRTQDVLTIAANNRAMALETEDKELDEPTVLQGTRAVFDDTSRGFYLLADREGRIIGQLMVTFEWSDWRNGVLWWIQSVYVQPDQRGQGVFRSMYERLCSMARDNGSVCGLRLYALQGNEIARATYRSLGMVPTGYELFEADWSGLHR